MNAARVAKPERLFGPVPGIGDAVARPARARVQPGRGSRDGLGRAQEDRVGVASRAADAVEHLVDSVYQVYISVPRLAVHHLGARGAAGARMTGEIVLAHVRLGLHDASEDEAGAHS